ncbi:SAP domain-containing protein [Nocardioides sp. LHG3406-4]|uniref:SAP domain-containing protein n=1 Tax=Nocardioides sp. LHG3406-4 TaxID=2804575 RepID=UPI003CF1BDEC
MHDFVRVELENGARASVPAGFAARHNLQALKDARATDGRGRALPATPPAPVAAGAYDDHTVDQLRAEIKRRNGERPDAADHIPASGNKADLVKALEADDTSEEDQ